MKNVIGHSHTACLNEAALSQGVEVRCLHLWCAPTPILSDDEAPPRLNPEFEALLAPSIISMIGGAAHDLVGLIQHPHPFDFVLASEPDLPLAEGAHIVSQGAIERTLRQLISREEMTLPSLIAATGRTVVHVESPPPYGDNDVLSREVGLMIALWKRPIEAGDQPSSPWLRYKLWRLHSQIIERACRSGGVAFIAAPPEALIDGSFLRPDLYAYPCHANAGYGALLLDQLGLAG